MESFNLNKHLADFYDNKPKTSQRPIIGITTNYEGVDATVRDRYYRQIIKAGGTPVLIPPVADDFAASGKQWLESAILFESGFDRRIAFDHIVCVTAPRPVRIQRIVQRDNITLQRAAEWIDVQMSQQEVAQHSDFCIQNDGESDLQAQIDDILRQIAINN